ncbi:hypothetical protein GCM10010174_64190 [Kutzneria viridogrisea]|uniref:Uncharacterized protein n=2 Tax=Kutzneria TaxID=43356 RepID=W5WI01_9PSEU|nr:helix-turn-helix transcriptional regulator [Kutzneria albida]AHI00493.1 hypothetical protein KALB_7135 [Kutzneria albida DSM 43870]MBA8925672.1 hypothetical protein [Kutzneria viridogrisea]
MTTEPTPLPPSADDLDARLAEALRYGPFPRALRAAIAHRGLSLARLGVHLDRLGVHVGQSTLSYWQRGLRHPEVPRALGALRALEKVLALPPDSLVVLVGPRARPASERATAAAFLDFGRLWSGSAALLSELDAMPEITRCNAELEVLSVHDFVVIDQYRVQRAVTTRIVVRAMRAGPDRYLAMYHADDNGAIGASEVRTGEGCRTGRVRRHAETGTMLTELLFDRRLTEGERHVFSFSLHDQGSTATPGSNRTFREPGADYLLQLSFHRRAMPARCTQYFRVREDAEPTQAEDLVCGIGGVVSAYFSRVGRGLAGIAVDWD